MFLNIILFGRYWSLKKNKRWTIGPRVSLGKYVVKHNEIFCGAIYTILKCFYVHCLLITVQRLKVDVFDDDTTHYSKLSVKHVLRM